MLPRSLDFWSWRVLDLIFVENGIESEWALRLGGRSVVGGCGDSIVDNETRLVKIKALVSEFLNGI
jgi:hypothetical protein